MKTRPPVLFSLANPNSPGKSCRRCPRPDLPSKTDSDVTTKILNGSRFVNIEEPGIGAIEDQVVESKCSCCKFPCVTGSGTVRECKASGFLRKWQTEHCSKPRGFDKIVHQDLGNGGEVAFFSYGGRRGPKWKACNQDDFFVLPLLQEGESEASHFVLGVFDGHGENGQGVASLLRETFYKEFSRFAEKRRNNYFSEMRVNENLIRDMFREVESVVEAHPDDLSNSGATAVIVAVSPTLVTSAWLGDSRAILGLTEAAIGSEDLGRQTRALIPLTQDHKPDPYKCPSEARRILGVGGRIDRLYTDSEGRPLGPYRIFLQNQWSPGLAVSRSFGDFVAQKAGLIAEPDIQTLSIPGTPQSGFKDTDGFIRQKHVIIVGSDGLWEWISNEEAMQIAWEMESAKDVAFKLAEIAKKHWAVKCGGRVCDDITVGVTFLPVE